ncbi:hypothetical protein ACFL9T_09715 [Thermodesulfobacteriota bacterium]
MGFADVFSAILFQAFDRFEVNAPTPRARLVVFEDTVYSVSAAFTIAAQPNPDIALLDMVVLTTLGRKIYEEHYLEKYGSPADEIFKGFLMLEQDIWQIAAKVLSLQYQRDLREMIRDWRRNHPDQLGFSYLRFNDFASERKKSTLAKAVASGGMFGSVKEATKEVEKTRLLAERALFLATRLPLLGGNFVDAWLSRWLNNPDMERVLANMDKVSESSVRLSEEIQELPDRFAIERDKTVDQVMGRMTSLRLGIVDDVMGRVTVEREATITQFMDRLADERKSFMQDLKAGQGEFGPLLENLQKALTEGKDLMQSVNLLVEQLEVGKPNDDAKPFNINDYRETALELSKSAERLNMLFASFDRLLGSPGWEKALPQIVAALDEVGKEGEELIDHTFQKTLLLITIGLVGFFVLLFLYRYTTERMFGTRHHG